MPISERRYLFFKEWVAKYIRFCNYPANDHGAGGLNRIYLATAKAGGPPQAERLSETAIASCMIKELVLMPILMNDTNRLIID